jgi:hypothetical protein
MNNFLKNINIFEINHKNKNEITQKLIQFINLHLVN